MTSSQTALVPVFTGTLASQPAQLCNARDLHVFMGVKRDFTTWIKGRIGKYGFQAGIDYLIVENLSSPDLGSAKSRAQTLHDYHLTLDTAKELAMVENNEKGRQVRRYFIECERVRKALAAEELITTGQARNLQTAVATRAHEFHKDARGAVIHWLWTAHNTHFNIASYRELPAAKFDEAIRFPQNVRINLQLPRVATLPAPMMRERLEDCTIRMHEILDAMPILEGQKCGANERRVSAGDLVAHPSPSLWFFRKLEDTFNVRIIDPQREVEALRHLLAQYVRFTHSARADLDFTIRQGICLSFD